MIGWNVKSEDDKMLMEVLPLSMTKYPTYLTYYKTKQFSTK